MRRRSFRGTRQRTEWLGAFGVPPTTVVVNSNAATTLLTQAALEEFPGARIDKLLGQLFISPATAPAAATGYGVFIGFALVSGGSSYDPELNPEHRWLYWNSCFPQIGGTAAADSNASRWVGYFRFDFHHRIRRRPAEDDSLVLFVKNSNNSGASIQFSYAFRFLLALGAK